MGEEARQRFTLLEGDIRDRNTCEKSFAGVAYVLHQAGLGSVPRSLATHMAADGIRAAMPWYVGYFKDNKDT